MCPAGMADEHLISLQPGTVIAGRYEVVKCLGAGSMGLVYACRHRELAGHLVAVKVLFPEVACDKIAAARFQNEIFASYGVSHPNVVRAYEYLKDGNLIAYTMEYVDGGALADKLEDPEKPLPVPEIVNYISQMCCGVQAIHDSGIVHRDLKPENILLTKDSIVKIADFGIARTGHGPRLTEHGGVVGTIDYVSPEYMLNSQVDWRSDIYAIGILGYEMITGESPFRGDSVYATMTKRLKSDAKPPSQLRRECPKRLDQIILKAMARNPEDRYQSASEMFYDLQELMPHAASTSSGAFQMRPKAGRTYVGPVLEEGPAGDGKPRMSVREDSTGTEIRGLKRKLESGGAKAAAWDSKIDHSHILDRNDGSIIDTHILDANDVYQEDTIHEPVKMEQMLAYKDLVSGTWENPLIPREVSITGSTIDEERLKRLSKIAENVNRSIWIDVILSVFAVMIGIGIGFAALRMAWPGLFE